MNTSFAKRGTLDIICEILLASRKPVRKTRILYKCNLSHDLIQKYLEYLAANGLITQFMNNEVRYFQITKKGKDFLEGCVHLNALLEGKC